jgi:hypothetical protein
MDSLGYEPIIEAPILFIDSTRSVDTLFKAGGGPKWGRSLSSRLNLAPPTGSMWPPVLFVQYGLPCRSPARGTSRKVSTRLAAAYSQKRLLSRPGNERFGRTVYQIAKFALQTEGLADHLAHRVPNGSGHLVQSTSPRSLATVRSRAWSALAACRSSSSL